MVELSEGLSFFEKFLAVWIAVCMILGVAISQIYPDVANKINSWQVHGISIPIGVCLFLMMYPALLNLQMAELKKLLKHPKPILLTVISNWIVAPIIALVLAGFFLKGQDQLIISVILLGASPCTAMVLVWGALAGGNQEQNIVNTTLNTLAIMFLYAPLVSLMTGMQSIPIDRIGLIISAVVFIGIPIIFGYVSKKLITNRKGEKWFHDVYRPAIGNISIFALLTTLVVLFALNGDVLLRNPQLLALVSLPLLAGFAIIVAFNLIATKLVGLKYKEGIITVLIGSSSHFEIAIATAVSLYGVGSKAALGTTMGLFWEVPVMLGLVYFGKKLDKRGFWGKEPPVEAGRVD